MTKITVEKIEGIDSIEVNIEYFNDRGRLCPPGDNFGLTKQEAQELIEKLQSAIDE